MVESSVLSEAIARPPGEGHFSSDVPNRIDASFVFMIGDVNTSFALEGMQVTWILAILTEDMIIELLKNKYRLSGILIFLPTVDSGFDVDAVCWIGEVTSCETESKLCSCNGA
jgi:hypothetical protein